MKIQNVNDESFKKYGKVLNGYHVAGILKEMEHTQKRLYMFRQLKRWRRCRTRRR